MPATIINRGKYFQAARAFAEGDKLWLAAEELRRATGWELKPQGFCMEDRCVPAPPGREAEFRSSRDESSSRRRPGRRCRTPRR